MPFLSSNVKGKGCAVYGASLLTVMLAVGSGEVVPPEKNTKKIETQVHNKKIPIGIGNSRKQSR
jgi:hypothetical protein